MKKILLLAYTNKNFGDDMFVKTICDYYPNQQFAIEATNEYISYFKDIVNLEVITDKSAKKLYKKFQNKLRKIGLPNLYFQYIKQYKAIVYVIGGLFDEDDEWKNNIKIHGLQGMKSMFWHDLLWKDVPFFLLGCNITRIKTNAYVNQMSYIFDGIYDICFRDKYSYNAFMHLKNVRYAPDIILNYQAETCKKNKNLIMLSIWGPLTRCEDFPQWKWAEHLWEPYKMFMVEIVKYFLGQGKDVHLLALCENEGDVDACKEIIKAGKFKDKITIDVYNGNLNETIDLFEQAGFIVGTRFHSVVMAMNTKTPCYPIVYESKTLQLLKDAQYSGSYSYIEDSDSYNLEKVKIIYENSQIIECEKLKKEAKFQFEKLSDYLNE